MPQAHPTIHMPPLTLRGGREGGEDGVQRRGNPPQKVKGILLCVTCGSEPVRSRPPSSSWIT